VLSGRRGVAVVIALAHHSFLTIPDPALHCFDVKAERRDAW
jgi:hypothetical protein